MLMNASQSDACSSRAAANSGAHSSLRSLVSQRMLSRKTGGLSGIGLSRMAKVKVVLAFGTYVPNPSFQRTA